MTSVRHYRRYGHDDCGVTGEWAGGNGSIMRLAPVPIFYQEFGEFAEQVSVTQGILTHNHEVPNDGCRLLSKIIVEGIRTGDKHAALSSVETLQVADKILHVKNREYEEKDRNHIKSDGYVVSTLEAAMWSVWKTDNFKDALLLAVNLGDDADTVGAVAGQIAGAIYGIEEIPKEWVSDLTQSPRILEYGQKLFEQRHTP